MSEHFDPYYKWLAIPPEEQPPHHYRLLGVKPFESDPDVIESAADQRMVHLRNFQSGKNARHSQKLLNEVSAAKVVLLTPEKRAKYDQQLRGKLEERPLPKALPMGTPLPPASPPPMPVASSPAPLPVAAAMVPPSGSQPAPPVAPVGVPVTPAVEPKPGAYGVGAATHRSMAGRRKPNWVLPLLIAGGMGGVLALFLCAGGLYYLLSAPEETDVVINETDGDLVPSPRSDESVFATDGDEPPADDGGVTDGTDTDGSDGRPVDAVPAPGSDPFGAPMPGAAHSGTSPPDDPFGTGAPPTGGAVPAGGADPFGNRPPPTGTPAPVGPPTSPDPMPVEPMPVDPMPVEPAKPKKAEFPAKADLDAAVAEVAEIMKLDQVTDDKERLTKAEEMLRLAKDTKASLSQRYALLRKATDLARDAGDAAIVLRAVDQMDQVFDFDADKARGTLLADVAGSVRSPESIQLLMANSGVFLEEVIERDRLDVALELAEKLHGAILRKGKFGQPYRKQLNEQRNEVKRLHAVWQRAEQARTALEDAPDDPSLNLVLGRYLGLNKGEFKEAVEHLVKTDEQMLKSAAEKDQAAQQSRETADMLAAADAWYEAAEQDETDAAFFARAHHWYESVKDDVSSLDKLRVDDRLSKIAKVEAAQRLLASIAATDEEDDDAPKRVVAKKVATFPSNSSGYVHLAFLPDGKTIVAGYNDGSLKFWDVETRQAAGSYPGHSSRIYDIAVSDDGTIVSVGGDENAFIWNEKGEKAPLTHSDRGYFQMAAFAPSGVLVLARSSDISFWNLSNVNKPQLLRPPLTTNGQRFEQASFSPDGTMAFASYNKVVLSAANGRALPPVDTAQQVAEAAAFSPDGRLLALAPENGQIVLYDAIERKSRPLDSYTSVDHLRFSPDGKTLAAGRSNSVQLLDVETGQPWTSLNTTNIINSLEFSPDGDLLASGGSDGSITLWEISRERILSPPPRQAELAGSDEPGAQWELRGTLDFSSNVSDVKFSPDGKRLAVTDRNAVRVYDADNGTPLGSLSGHQAPVQKIAWSPDSKRIATAAANHTIRVWDAATWEETAQIHGANYIRAICFSGDGKQLMVARQSGVQLHSTSADYVATPLDLGASASISGGVTAPDGSAFALVVQGVSGSRPRPTVFTFDSNSPKAELSNEWYVKAISDGGTHVVAYTSSSMLHVYTGDMKKPLSTIRTSSSARGAAFHPGKKMLALGAYDGLVALCDVQTGKPILALRGHNGGVGVVDFSPDGKSLATGSDDDTVKIWSPKKSAE